VHFQEEDLAESGITLELMDGNVGGYRGDFPEQAD
jgi:hypothetical protein